MNGASRMDMTPEKRKTGNDDWLFRRVNAELNACIQHAIIEGEIIKFYKLIIVIELLFVV